MAVDVSVYNEIAKGNLNLVQCVSSTFNSNYNTGFSSGISAATTVNAAGQVCYQAIYPTRLACDLIAQPWCCCYWAAIPTLPSVTGGTLVYDATYGRCGSCCAWTVPGGAQFIRFQMWGAGAMSLSSPCYCGISIPGSSGAYASVILPAVPGCVYTLCAGCAACCNPDVNNGSTIGSGCASYVTGYGISGVCAEGGEVSPFCWMKREKAVNGVDDADFASLCVMLPNSNWSCNSIGKTISSGYCMCGFGGFCMTSSCCSTGPHPFVTSCKTFYGTVTNPTRCCHFVIGTPGAWASLVPYSLSTTYFYAYFPPTTCISCACSSHCYNIGTDYCCSYGMAISYPGQRPDYAYGKGGGGSNSNVNYGNGPGFPGAGGAVCVQYL
jgi:hypothetical protein